MQASCLCGELKTVPNGSLAAPAFPARTPMLESFGVKFTTGGAHISRTMMLGELGAVLAAVPAGSDAIDYRAAILQAAKQLQAKLKLILEGEPPYDTFVRWKALAQQPIGWHPDLNDGVRMNIRPFATADILRKRVKINWEKDRGKEPVRGKAEFPWFWGRDEVKQDFAGVGKEPDGNRWNNCHYSNAVKQAAKAAQGARK